MGRSELILGGARSGKSRFAQARAEQSNARLVYIATAQAFDEEMHDRIQLHQADRDGRWETIEAPIALCDAISQRQGSGDTLLVDCLTLWTSNLILEGHDAANAGKELCTALQSYDGLIILVANEVGLGIVPENALARRFRDEAGRLNQAVAASAEAVFFIAAGLPLRLK